MPRPEKVETIAEFKKAVEDSAIAIATQYKGITVAEVTELRAKLRAENVRFKVYKNTLVKRALDELELSDAAVHIEGPTAWAFCEDPVTPARILMEFSKNVKVISMQGGILDGNIIGAEQLSALASLPSKDQLLAQVVGTIAMPLRNLVGVLNALPRNLVNVLDQIQKQKEEAEAA